MSVAKVSRNYDCSLWSIPKTMSLFLGVTWNITIILSYKSKEKLLPIKSPGSWHGCMIKSSFYIHTGPLKELTTLKVIKVGGWIRIKVLPKYYFDNHCTCMDEWRNLTRFVLLSFSLVKHSWYTYASVTYPGFIFILSLPWFVVVCWTGSDSRFAWGENL